MVVFHCNFSHITEKQLPYVYTNAAEGSAIMKTLKSTVLIASIVATTSLFSSSASAEQWVLGTSPSGEEVRVVIKKTPPLEYPRRAMRMQVEGFVQIGFDINDQGRALNIVIEDAQPKRMFDKAATKLIKGIVFESPEQLGQPVSVTDVSMKIAFAL